MDPERGYVLIADSGATKCSWALVPGTLRFETCGLNLAVASHDDVHEFVNACVSWLSDLAGAVSAVCVYAAGVTGEAQSRCVRDAFLEAFPSAEVSACSDMLGAARAVCGRDSGIVGVLGTGSNSCLYDGTGIVLDGCGGGYVLGDEGSGAWVGRHLLSDFIRGLLPGSLSEQLKDKYNLDYQSIVEGVYRSGTPGRYLASFFPFVLEQARDGNSWAESLLREGFGAFLDRCILPRYGCLAGKLNLCGSVAWLCRDMIGECAASRGIVLGNVLRSPVDGLVKYHSEMEKR